MHTTAARKRREEPVDGRVIAIEYDLLGCLINNPALLPQVVGFLGPEHFLLGKDREVYSAILSLFTDGTPITPTSIADMVQRGNSTFKGAYSYITDLIIGGVQESLVKYNAEQIVKHYNANEVRSIVKEAEKILGEDPGNIDSALCLMQSAAELADVAIDEKSFVIASDIVANVFETIHQMNTLGNIPGLKTHLRRLNEYIRLTPGELTVVAARTSKGKTAFISNLAEYICRYENQPVVFFSLEMNAADIVKRLLFSLAHMDSRKLLYGKYTDEQWKRFINAANIIESFGKNLIIIDYAGLTPLDIRGHLQRLTKVKGIQPGAVFVDYLQIVLPEERSGSREQDVAAVTRSMKRLAKDFHVPFIVACQFNREIDKGNKKESTPQLIHLRESGAIEQDSDIVLAIHHPQKPPNPDGSTMAEIYILKNRNGAALDRVECLWNKTYTRFENIDYHREEEAIEF